MRLEARHVRAVALLCDQNPHRRERPHRLPQRAARKPEQLSEVVLLGSATRLELPR